MTDCTPEQLQFPNVNRREISTSFTGGDVTGDGGSLLLRQIDRKLKLLNQVAPLLIDPRDPHKVQHSCLDLLRQRVYGLALGYEDLNDHDQTRKDIGFQTAVEKDSNLASSATLCRFENRANLKSARAIQRMFVEQFIASYKTPPKELILDFDATDDPIHGQQEGRFFHGYYKSYCFLPLYVFCGEQLLVSYLRPSKIDGALHAGVILALLVKKLRKAWPEVRIIFRGDGGFCRHRMFEWCEKNDVSYITGIGRNDRLQVKSAVLRQKALDQFEETKDKQRLFDAFHYSAKTWSKERRVIVKAEHADKGANPRYIVTNLKGDPQEIYNKVYCARGDMENRIKEQQLYLFADRTSCHDWQANQFRLLLSSLAYILIEGIRRLALKGTKLAKAQCGTIRLKLLKVGAVIIKNTRRIRFMLSSAYPYKDLFLHVAHQLDSS